MRFRDKVVIVTGGGRGIGAATAQHFHDEGATVFVWEIRAEETNEQRCHVRSVDVTDAAQLEAATREAIATAGGVDVLINNAGIIDDGFATDLTLERWERVLRVNLTGTFLPSQAVIPHFRERQGGIIVNTSSISALGNRGQSNYAASKAGVIGLTRTLALELARDGIRCNGVAPGVIDTEMFAQVPEKIRAKFLAKVPLGRLGRPEDIARLHAFLASDDASYITGQTLFCDGGLTL